MLVSKFLLRIIIWCCLLSAEVVFGVSLPENNQPITEIAEPEPEPEPAATTETTPPVPAVTVAETPQPPPPDPALVLPEQCRKLAKIDIRLDKIPLPTNASEATPKKVAVIRLYEAMNNSPLWIKDGAVTAQAEFVIQQLLQADSKGLSASVYTNGVNWSEFLKTASEGTERICRDLSFSVTTMLYMTHLRMGQINPTSLETQFNTKRDVDFSSKRLDTADFIIKLAQSKEPSTMLNGLESTLFPYQTLVNIVQNYHKFKVNEQLKKSLAGVRKKLRPGQRYKDAALLALHLEAIGDSPPGQAAIFTEPVYSNELAEGIKKFQKRNGLHADGILGVGTIRALSNPTGAGKIKQILAILERWRWMPNNLGYRPILVNIPEYKLYALEDDGKGWYKTAFEMNVVVGKNDPKYRTPMIQSAIQSIEFTPYWNVPLSILRNELYASVRSGRIGGNYEVVGAAGKKVPINKNTLSGLWQGSYQLRQKPGAHNVLGVAKFRFPNIDGVYLHDTQSKGAFGRSNRALSHGCVRLADPKKLATHIMSIDDGWDLKKVNAEIAKKKNKTVKLKTPVAVYLLYNTIMVKSDGTLKFIPDIYGYDPILMQALEEAKKMGPLAR